MHREPTPIRRVWLVASSVALGLAIAAIGVCTGSARAADAPAFDPLASVKAGLGSPIRVEAVVEKSPAGRG